jgi:hypothetical protein
MYQPVSLYTDNRPDNGPFDHDLCTELVKAAEVMETQAALLRRYVAGDTSEEVLEGLFAYCGPTHYRPVELSDLPAILENA